MDLHGLLTEYGTWVSRQVAPTPRRCHLSAELVADPLAKKHQDDLDGLVAKIEVGADLRDHLSRHVWVGHDPDAPSLTAREDRDLLLADWGVHHLHLTPGHGDDLVFAMFRPRDAYLIGVYKHRDWAKRSVLEIVIDNWPEAGLVMKLNGVIGLTHEWTDRERKQIREAGISGAMIEYDGGVWMSASLGQTAAGTPMTVAREIMKLEAILDDWRNNLAALLASATEAVYEHLGGPVDGQWEPMIHDGAVGIVLADCLVPICRLPSG